MGNALVKVLELDDHGRKDTVEAHVAEWCDLRDWVMS